MQAPDSFAQILSEFAHRHGVNGSLSAARIATFEIEGIPISVESPRTSAFAYFHAPYRRLEADRTADLERLIRMNLFQTPVSGAWFAYDEVSEDILLCYAAAIETLTHEQVARILAALAHGIVTLRNSDQATGTSFPHPRDSYILV